MGHSFDQVVVDSQTVAATGIGGAMLMQPRHHIHAPLLQERNREQTVVVTIRDDQITVVNEINATARPIGTPNPSIRLANRTRPSDWPTVNELESPPAVPFSPDRFRFGYASHGNGREVCPFNLNANGVAVKRLNGDRVKYSVVGTIGLSEWEARHPRERGGWLQSTGEWSADGPAGCLRIREPRR